MQIPKRKPGKFSNIPKDFNITEKKHNELQSELESLKQKQPHAISEVERLGAMGDFSENAAYQMAKGRLRRINYRINEIENFLKYANIIKPPQNSEYIQIGHIVTIELLDSSSSNKKFTFTILGSSETNPSAGIISKNSALGTALLGKKINDTVIVDLGQQSVAYKILTFK